MKVEVLPGYHVPTGLRKKPFYPGEQFEVDDKEGRRLVQANVVKEVAGPASDEKKQLNVADTVALVAAATTVEELDKLAQDEKRKGVLDAIEKRRAELEKPAQ